MAGGPDVASFMPVPVATDPNVMVGRAGNDDFVHGGRRWFGDEYFCCSRRLGGVPLPKTGTERVTVVTGFPVRPDKGETGCRWLAPTAGVPGVGTIAPAPVSRNPYGLRKRTCADGFRWGRRWRLADDDFGGGGRSGNGGGGIGVLPVAVDKQVTVIAAIPARGNINHAFARREFPSPGNPDVLIILPAPAAGYPDVTGRWAGDDHLVAWRGRRISYNNTYRETDPIGS